MAVRHANTEIDGAKLRELRKEAGLSVSQAAAKMGISAPYLSAIEHGHRPTLPPARFNSICKAMGVDRSKLLAVPPAAQDVA